MKHITLYAICLLTGLFWCLLVILAHKINTQRFIITEQQRLLSTANAQIEQASNMVHKTHATRP